MVRRRFGRVRRLPSGRWQARYPGPDGIDRPAPMTFATKTEAARWLALIEAELVRDEWINPRHGEIPLREYAVVWLKERPGLRPKTVVLYDGLIKNHIAPTGAVLAVRYGADAPLARDLRLGDLPLGALSPDRVRAWRSALLASGVSTTTAAKAYRLLRAILATAVDDGMIRRNPCRLRRAGFEPTPERPTASVGQVLALAVEMPARYRVLILLAAFASLRWGELIALRRRDVDIRTGAVRVLRTITELPTGELVIGPPKSRAGVRHVAIPLGIAEQLRDHLAMFGTARLDDLIFTGEHGQPLRRSNFNKTTRWRTALAAVGLPAGFRFHDLRHTGNTLAAETGASTRELMERMGHDSSHAALIYQHGSARRDRAIADALDGLIERERTRENDVREEPTGT